jgi:glycosyltransferase involved in cell wall biosynthesis
MSGGFVARWREYEENQALDGALLRLGARLTPRPRSVALDPRPAPLGRTRVSVVIPCYNYGRYLPDAVASALEQPGVDVEVIIVDDQSTDDSHEIAEALAGSDERIRVLQNKANSGHVRSFNAGWAVSTGELVVKLDADDLLTPGSLARAAALFEAQPSVTLVYGHPRHFAGSPPAGRVRNLRWEVWRGQDWLTERCRRGVSAITNPEMVLSSDFLRTSGPMNPEVPFAPDMEVSLRAAACGDVGYIGGADQALHREHSDSMSETDGSGSLVDLQARTDAFRFALARTQNRVRGVGHLGVLWRRAVAEDALRSASADRDHDLDATVVARLVEFACRIWPDLVGSSEVQQVTGPASRSLTTRAAVLVRRTGRRLRYERYYLRWMVFGV